MRSPLKTAMSVVILLPARARAGRDICSIHPRWQFHVFVLLLLHGEGKAGPHGRKSPEAWVGVSAQLCVLSKLIYISSSGYLFTIILKR